MEYWVYPAISAAVLGLSGLISYLFKIGLKKKTKEKNVAEQKKKYRTRAKRKFKQKKKSLKTIIKKKSNANKKNKVTFQNPVVKYAKQPKPSINFSNDKTDGNVNAQKKTTANVQQYNVNFITSNSNKEASDISDLSDLPNKNEEPENVILIPLIMQLSRTEIQNFVDLVKNRTIEFIEKSNSLQKNSCPRCVHLPETHLKSEEIQSNVFFQKLENVKKFTAALGSTLYLENLYNCSVLTREELEVYQRITPMRHIFDYWDTSAKVKMPHLMEFANVNKESENVILLIPLIMQLSRTEIQNFVDRLNTCKKDVGPLFKTPPKSEEVQSNMFLPNFRDPYSLLWKLDFFMGRHISSMPSTKVTVLSREQLEAYQQMTPMRNIFDYWDPSAEEFVLSSETINYSKQ